MLDKKRFRAAIEERGGTAYVEAKLKKDGWDRERRMEGRKFLQEQREAAQRKTNMWKAVGVLIGVAALIIAALEFWDRISSGP